MAITIMIHQLIMFIVLASITIASPLGVVQNTTLPSKITSVSTAVNFSDGITDATTMYASASPVLQSWPDELRSDAVADGEMQVDTTQTGRHIGVLSSLNEIDVSTFADQNHKTKHYDIVKPDARLLVDLHTTDETVENTFTSQEISPRDATEAMGYHNYAMVCAESKVHTDYCANRRRGYYCSQNGFLQIYAVSSPISLKRRAD